MELHPAMENGEIVNVREVFLRHIKIMQKHAVGLPLASQYNETVAVNLHDLEPGVWYLHIIDQFTGMSAGSIQTTKKSSEIVKYFACAHLKIFSVTVGESLTMTRSFQHKK